MTQAEFSKFIGVNRSLYSQIESGSRKCTSSFLEKLQTSFNIPDEEMWKLIKNTRKKKESDHLV